LDVLIADLSVDRGNGVQLLFNPLTVLWIKQDTELSLPVSPYPGASSNNTYWENQVFENGVVDGCERP
jgi:hypothetical protein